MYEAYFTRIFRSPIAPFARSNNAPNAGFRERVKRRGAHVCHPRSLPTVLVPLESGPEMRLYRIDVAREHQPVRHLDFGRDKSDHDHGRVFGKVVLIELPTHRVRRKTFTAFDTAALMLGHFRVEG